MSSDAEEIKNDAAAAEVSDIAWGRLGKATVHGSYAELLEAFQTHLDEISAGLTRAGDDLAACGEEYRSIDEQAAEELGRIGAGGDAG
ncbi:hypothetical protein LZ318_35355 [Saccharopolyspora indica]|uniref:hypothetical protein n=1 Tax=Saccharopolyspora indica TaxID=1229659 RepID=UPI0022EAE9E1|nr:hypothetical protein [Saccharopolyspora indica]MDA3647237.1 hypothetical protein [Saccharopolyspora indica]